MNEKMQYLSVSNAISCAPNNVKKVTTSTQTDWNDNVTTNVVIGNSAGSDPTPRLLIDNRGTNQRNGVKDVQLWLWNLINLIKYK